jgi:hypothetical protein
MFQAGNLARKGNLCINFHWPRILSRAILRNYHRPQSVAVMRRWKALYIFPAMLLRARPFITSGPG